MQSLGSVYPTITSRSFDGTHPLMSVSLISSTLNSAKSPNSGGIGPLNSLLEISKLRNSVSSPNCAGTVPHTPKSDRERCRTRGAARAIASEDVLDSKGKGSSKEIPSHCDIGVSLFQFSSALRENRRLTANSTSQSRTRPKFASGSGTTTPPVHHAGSTG